MFDAIKNIVQQATSGNLDPQALTQAATDHLGSVGGDELAGHLQTAATNLQQQGQGDLAQQAMALVSQVQSNPGEAKGAIVSFITSNPQVLQHFAPEFAQGILSRIGV
ncbi:MAG: hypothetical protein ABI231_00455 [Candidatus Tumulicola sp.]